MRSVKIGQLKNKLSAYLRLVRKGVEVIIMDRQHPIARITPFEEKQELRIIPSQKKFSEIKKLSFPKPKVQIDVVALLREDRDKR